jgi:hypothetical protein
MTVDSHESHSTSPFQEFFRTEAAAGFATCRLCVRALVVANSAWADGSHRLWATPVVIAGGGHALSLTLHQWINDGLMAVFFLLVGLEIKREALAGGTGIPASGGPAHRGRDRRHDGPRLVIHIAPIKARSVRGAGTKRWMRKATTVATTKQSITT